MKKIILSLSLLLLMSISFGQSFMHGAGITIMGGYTHGGDFTFAEGFTYSPRFNFVETEKLSVSVGIPLSVGISASNVSSYDYYTDSYSYDIGFVLNVPAVVSLNVGRGSTKDNRTKFGYFVGAGYGYNHGSFLGTAELDQNGGLKSSNDDNTGPVANAGMRFGVGRKHKNVEVRFSYFKGLNDKKPNLFGIAGLFNF